MVGNWRNYCRAVSSTRCKICSENCMLDLAFILLLETVRCMLVCVVIGLVYQLDDWCTCLHKCMVLVFTAIHIVYIYYIVMSGEVN